MDPLASAVLVCSFIRPVNCRHTPDRGEAKTIRPPDRRFRTYCGSCTTTPPLWRRRRISALKNDGLPGGFRSLLAALMVRNCGSLGTISWNGVRSSRDSTVLHKSLHVALVFQQQKPVDSGACGLQLCNIALLLLRNTVAAPKSSVAQPCFQPVHNNVIQPNTPLQIVLLHVLCLLV